MKFLYKHRKLLLVILALGLIIALAPKLIGLSAQDLLEYTPSSPILAALVLFFVYCIKPIVMVIPSYGVYIASGMLFPAGWAILINYIGLAAQLSIGFLIGRWLGRERVNALVAKSARAAKVIRYVDDNSQLVCFATRVLPMPYPVDLGSMFFAASGMPYLRHLIFSLLGFTPIMIPLTIAGGAISNPLSPEFLVPFGISITVCISLFALYRVWLKRKKAATTLADDSAEGGKDENVGGADDGESGGG